MKHFANIKVDERLSLRETRKDDGEILDKLLEDYEFVHFLPVFAELVKELGFNHVINAFNDYSKNKEGMMWTIDLNNKLIGYISIMDLPIRPTLFYALLSDYRRQGYMYQCVRTLLDILFKERIFSSLHTVVLPQNHRSINLLTKLGFRFVESNESESLYVLER